MFEHISNDEISTILDELVELLGVREDIPTHVLYDDYGQIDERHCLNEIVKKLCLPVAINIVKVPKYQFGHYGKRFNTTGLANTGANGRGAEGIAAQVMIPGNVPLYGSQRLDGFPITVMLGDGCCDRIFTFVTVMAHELSHVLLETLQFPKRDSELYTDLVPIVMGFGGDVRAGRKASARSLDGTHLCETTFGYLTDQQFNHAMAYTCDIVSKNRRPKVELTCTLEALSNEVLRCERCLDKWHNCLDLLDSRKLVTMEMAHASRMVSFHQPGYTDEWSGITAQAKEAVIYARSHEYRISHYTAITCRDISSKNQELMMMYGELQQIAEHIQCDLNMMERYMGFKHRFKKWLTLNMQGKGGEGRSPSYDMRSPKQGTNRYITTGYQEAWRRAVITLWLVIIVVVVVVILIRNTI